MYPEVAENEDYAGVINERHFERLEAHLKDAVAKGAKLTIVGAEKTRPIEEGGACLYTFFKTSMTP